MEFLTELYELGLRTGFIILTIGILIDNFDARISYMIDKKLKEYNLKHDNVQKNKI